VPDIKTSDYDDARAGSQPCRFGPQSLCGNFRIQFLSG